MKNIGLDLDGVLYNWHSAVYTYYVMYKNYQGTEREFWTTRYKTISDDEWDCLVNMDILYSSQCPTPECMSFIHEISKYYSVYYITSRPAFVKITTEQYLKRHKFPFLENLVFTHDKSITARQLMLSMCVDDMPKNLEPLSKVTDVVMIAHPYNVDYWDKFPTAHSLTSALKLIIGG